MYYIGVFLRWSAAIALVVAWQYLYTHNAGPGSPAFYASIFAASLAAAIFFSPKIKYSLIETCVRTQLATGFFLLGVEAVRHHAQLGAGAYWAAAICGILFLAVAFGDSSRVVSS
jgi:hypothetical protein